jgi:hypothetical protein
MLPEDAQKPPKLPARVSRHEQPVEGEVATPVPKSFQVGSTSSKSQSWQTIVLSDHVIAALRSSAYLQSLYHLIVVPVPTT